MASHADILDRPDPLTMPFWGSFAMHLVLIVGIFGGAIWEHRNHIKMGSATGGGFGSVTVSPVASIPLPNRGGPENPVANDTQSQVPTPPAPKEKAKPAPKVKAPTEKAVPLKFDSPRQKDRPQPPAETNKFRDQQKYSDSQLYSNSGQRMSSSTFAVQGGGGVRMGDSSPFGEQFGTYANLIRDNIARNWRPGELNLRTSGSPFVIITFTIRRDGSKANQKIGTASGYPAMDNSALRAVMDAQLPPLPPNFPRNEADVEMRFELGK